MTHIAYDDFVLEIERAAEGGYSVEVSSPAGEARGRLVLPATLDELWAELSRVAGEVRRGRGGAAAGPPVALRRLGTQLFQGLFSGPVRSRFDTCLGMIARQRERGLRLKLRIAPDCAELASLPWEYLYREDTREFLNLSRRTPIVRYLEVPRPVEPLPVEGPLRVLVVIASPRDYPPLDLAREQRLIQQALGEHPEVELDFLDQATPAALQRRLAQRDYHILHYMGHGGFDEQTGQGVLLLEDEEGYGQPLSGEDLGILLRDAPTVRLVFLNACETARVTRQQGQDPFAGVATALVLQGIPAVVAMQFPISDEAALAFAREFYPALAAGYPVDAAVAEGRKAIRLEDPGSMEWGTPVLFMRAPDGVIFRVKPAAVEEEEDRKPAPERPVVPPPVPALHRALSPKTIGIIGGAIVALLLIFVALRAFVFPPGPGRVVKETPSTVIIPTAVLTPIPPLMPTPSPTPTPLPYTVADRFRPIWESLGGAEGRLGNPVGKAVFDDFCAKQSFASGYMFWRNNQLYPGRDYNEIYTIAYTEGNDRAGKRWRVFKDLWAPPTPEYQCMNAKPPLGPKRGFGAIWCDRAEVQQELGKPVQEETTTAGGFQDFAGGVMLWVDLDHAVFVLFEDDHSWQRFDVP